MLFTRGYGVNIGVILDGDFRHGERGKCGAQYVIFNSLDDGLLQNVQDVVIGVIFGRVIWRKLCRDFLFTLFHMGGRGDKTHALHFFVSNYLRKAPIN